MSITTTSHSLTRRLLLSLILPMLLFLAVAASISVWVTSRSINQLYDQQMIRIADVLSAYLQFEGNEYSFEDDDDDDEEDDDDSDTDRDETAEEVASSDYEDSFSELSEELLELVAEIESQQSITVNYRLSIENQVIFTSATVAQFPRCGQGFDTIEVEAEREEDEYWRCYRRQHLIDDSQQKINTEVFEPTANRQDAIRALLLTSFTPLLFLPLLVTGIALWAVRRGMAEVQSFSDLVSQRSIKNLKPIAPQGKPKELQPVISSVNQLLLEIEDGFAREKRFTDDAAHELRTPITSIKMLEQLIRRNGGSPEQIENLNNLRAATDRCSYLIDQLLRLARYQSQQELQKEDTNVLTLLNEQLGLLSPQLTEKQLSVEWLNQDELVMVHADKAALSMLINNLLTNAIKFNKNKGSIYISLEQSGIRIEDDGAGIKEVDQKRVFDRFYRSSTTKDSVGSGLGLSLASWAAQAHGYDLRVVSAVRGSGAAFELVFGSSSVPN